MGAVPVIDFEKSKLKTSYCIDLDTRDRHVVENLLRVPGRVNMVEDRPMDEEIAVVCYGPSLIDTIEKIRSFKYIITCSGAHKMLIDRGIIPTWHCEVDPRPHKADLIGKPHKDVEYLLASVVGSAVLDLLEGHKVKLWHVFAHEAARTGVVYPYPRGEWAITGGTNIGMRALVLARFLGFRNLTVFGLDFSFRNDGTQHAGWHPKEVPSIHAVEVGGKHYFTSVPMHNYAQHFFHEVAQLGDVKLKLEGDGLVQALVREKEKTEPLIPQKRKKPAMIASQVPEVMSPAYLEQNRELHRTNPAYGISGSKRAEVVKKLITATKPASVLDYGCGKGTLALSLEHPIWEYDPAIPGKDAPPRPAELVICTDVLEHVEPNYIGNVLLDLARVVQKVGYIVVNTGPAQKTLPDGRNTHLLQRPLAWWSELISGFFDIAKTTQNGAEISYIVGPKKGGIGVKTPPVVLGEVPQPDFSKRVTPVRHKGIEAKFYTPNDTTFWRAQSLFTKEPITIEWIESFEKGAIFWDVGANVGGYSVWAAVSRGAKVVAFEPENKNFEILSQNLQLNEAQDCLAMNVALADTAREDNLYLGGSEIGGSCNTFGAEVGPFLKPRKAAGIQPCVATTIDALIAENDLVPPTYLKIDVDGNEPAVIKGAMKTLARPELKSILLEVNTNLSEHQEMIRVLRSVGFTFDPAQVDASIRKDGAFKGCAEFLFTRTPEQKKDVPNQHEPAPTPTREVMEHVYSRIARATVRTEPFDHVFVENFFPPAFYAHLLANMPARDLYKTIDEVRNTKNYPDRFVCDLQVSSMWAALEAVFRAGGLRKLLSWKFGISPMGRDECLLMRDRSGYKILPHTDTPSKAITMLVYLPSDLSLLPHGTSVYKPKEEGFTDVEGRHLPRDKFDLVWTAPFVPNSALLFARTDSSFHGVEDFDAPGKERNILLYDIRK